MRLDTYQSPTTYTPLIGSGTITTGVWHHVAGVFDGSQMRLYVDGALDATLATTNGPASGTSSLKIGRTSGSSYFGGLIDEARISNTAVYTSNFTPQTHLTASSNTKGLWKFDSQSPADSSGNGNNGTLESGAAYSADVPSGDGGGSQMSSGTGSQVQWLVSDHLGTPRMVIDQTGSLANLQRHDYLPFGEELFAPSGGRTVAQGYTSSDGVRQQFTLYERDNETALDYAKARYYASTQGRFTSPDPLPASGKAAIPQSWNRYSYVLNNPLKFIDPSGMMWVYHYLDKEHKRIGIAWIDGDKISKNLQAKGYQALNFGGATSKDIILRNGSVVRLSATSGRPDVLSGPRENGGDRAYVNTGLVNELRRQTAPIPAATGVFALASVAGGYTVGAAVGLSVANAAGYALLTASQMGNSGEQSPGEVVGGTRAVEYPAGQVSQTGFLDAAQKYLGPGYKELSPGRYVSADGMRQVRFGAHETRGPGLHGHFEAYDMAGGRVVENSVVKIRPR